MSSEPRFLCDAMLAGLGRRLRMAGYDTGIADGDTSDHELLLLARAGGRTFLTADRRVLEHAAARKPGLVLYLPRNDEALWTAELSARLGVSWLFRPFSRCLGCNAELIALPADKQSSLPEGAPKHGARWCPACAKAYWEGSHVRRMRARLEELEGFH